MSIKLSNLNQGDSAKILSLDKSEGEFRLKALGFIPGRKLLILKAGDPVILTISGTTVGIAEEVAESVQVTPLTKKL